MNRVGQLVFLFGWALIIGLVLVQLRTLRIQNVYRLTQLSDEQQQLRQEIWQQRILITASLQKPQLVKQRVENFDLAIVAPGVEPLDPLEQQVAFHHEILRTDD
jgi:hypothetical protein